MCRLHPTLFQHCVAMSNSLPFVVQTLVLIHLCSRSAAAGVAHLIVVAGSIDAVTQCIADAVLLANAILSARICKMSFGPVPRRSGRRCRLATQTYHHGVVSFVKPNSD
ncbi:uncharacterized protein UBRO_20601 [Ustilago bromivora]|uniref:Uncharacterized protein n=1 Tax=Ustilago bromivora TaxID=307758 RepID=A0A1K0GNF1_9BASI|nr:uncharacterized protein UBRO_20601 [Ustilago bromivora]